MTSAQRRDWAIGLTCLFVVTYVFVQNAWITEDAYITFRSVEQLMAGNGPRWNPHERVQAFTHPLWYMALSISRLIHSDLFINAITLSYLALIATLIAIGRSHRSWSRRSSAVILLVSSRSFIDFSTSGLENPLAYLLMAVFFGQLLKVESVDREARKEPIAQLSLWFGLLLLTRHDLLTLVGPAYVWVIAREGRRGVRRLWKPVLLGLSPFLLWTLFSIFYYGFPFPNTAYAKLNTGIDRQRLIAQGFYYLKSFGRFDPLLPAVISLGFLQGLLSSRGPLFAAALGLLINASYVVYVGGDFMAGRFLANAYLWAVLIVLQYPWPKRVGLSLLTIVAIFAVAFPSSPIRTLPSYEYRTVTQQVGDEKGIFFQITSLHQWWRTPEGEVFPRYRWSEKAMVARESPNRVLSGGNIGMFGYLVGTDKVIIDGLALSDPLLARMPCDSVIWRIGHFPRTPPLGYYKSVINGENLIVDENIHSFYGKLRIITEGDLFSLERLRVIVSMNLGFYDHLITPHE